MRSKSIFFIFILFLFTGAATAYPRHALVVSPGSGIANIDKVAATFLDNTSKITAQDIASGKYNDKFRYPDQEYINHGVTWGTSWCIFTLENRGSEKLYLSVHNPVADSIYLYKIADGIPVQIGLGSIYFPLASRQIRTEDFMFELDIVHDSATYILGIKSFRNQSYLLKAGYLSDFISTISAVSTWNAIYIGFMLLMALYNLFLFISVRSLPYLFYVGYIVSFGIFNAQLYGTAFLYFWPHHHLLNHYDNIAASMSSIFASLFTVTFLNTRKYLYWAYQALLLVAILNIIILLIALCGRADLAFILIQPVTLLAIILQVLSAVVAWRKGYKPARFFLIGWSFVNLGVIIFILSIHNVFKFNFFSEHILQIASAAEALMLSFALADRFNSYRKEKEALILSQNEMLEQKVSERTSELQKQQQESENLLLNILPAEIAAELKETGISKSRNFESVTVMFTDFKDFTKIVETISPEQLVSELNFCFSAFDKIIEKYNIEKIKTIGDAYMCAGGLYSSSEDIAANVVNAGIEIRDFMHQRNIIEAQKGSFILELRIGIHTGPVIAGIIGIKKFSYDIWGDTVNIASRMETAGEEGKVNISGATYDLIKQKFACEYRGKVPAKNKGVVDMYFAEKL